MTYRSKIIALSSLIALLSITFILGVFLLPYGPFARRSREALRDFDSALVQRIEIEAATSEDAADGDGGSDSDSAGKRMVLAAVSSDNFNSATNSGDGAGGVEGDGGADDGAPSREWQYLLGSEYVPAQSDRVETFLDVFAQLQRYRTVTTNRELHSELGVAENESAARALLYDGQGGTIVDLIQGNMDQRGVYTRLNNSDTVDLLSDELVFYLEQEAGYWQQTTLFSTDFGAADAISIAVFADNIVFDEAEEAISDQYQLVRVASSASNTGQLWQISGSEDIALDQLQVENLASAIFGLRADSFLEPRASQVDFAANARAQVIIEVGVGGRYIIEITELEAGSGDYVLRAEGPGVLARPDGSAYIYNVNRFSLRPLVRPLPELFPPPEESEIEPPQQ